MYVKKNFNLNFYVHLIFFSIIKKQQQKKECKIYIFINLFIYMSVHSSFLFDYCIQQNDSLLFYSFSNKINFLIIFNYLIVF